MEGSCPNSTRTDVYIAAAADLVINERQILSRMIAEALKFPKTVAFRILKEDLGKRKLCVNFFPQSLTPEQREDRFTCCQDIIAMTDAEKIFLAKLL
jgi:hypothetical protein